MAVTLNTTVAGGSGGSGSGDTLTAQTIRKRTMRPYFEAYRAQMMALYPPVANTGSVVYIDPSAGSDGSGTFASPRNVVPTLVNNTTYLFKERTRFVVTSPTLTGMSATGMVFGTYSMGDGSRVFQPERLATIDGGTYFRAAMRWQGTSGTFALSGLRIVGGYNASGGVNIFESVTAPAASTITVEHCVFEALGSYQLASGQINNQAIAIAGPRVVARFNRICAEADGIALSPGSGAGFEIICNEVTTPSGITAGGPDAIQISRSGTNPVGKQIVVGNWLDQAATTKQAYIVGGGTPQSTGEETIFARNFAFGTDVVAKPGLPPFGGGSVAYINDTTSVSCVVGNYFDQFCGWASVPGNSLLAFNIGVLEHTSTTQWLNGFEARSGGTGALIAHNTVIGLNRVVAYDGKSVGFYGANGANATFVNNICMNMEMKLGTGNAESYTLFQGSAPTNGSNVVQSLGTGSQTIADLNLDPVGRPLTGSSPAAAYASAVTWNNSPLRMGDIFGQTSWDTLSNYGGAQGWGG